MPTGYTADICDRENVSFREFALHCSMAFGVAIMQRDTGDRAPKKLDPDDYLRYNREQLGRAKNEFAKTQKRSDAEWRAAYRAYVDDVVESNHKSAVQATVLAAKLHAMRAQVETWDISDAKEELLPNLKAFMLEQLDSTIDFDAKPYYSEITPFAEWVKERKDGARRNVEYYTERLAEDEKRLETQHKNVDELLAHL